MSHLRAIFVAIIGYTLWVFNDGIIKFAAGAGIPPQEIMFVFGVVSVVFLLVKTMGQRKVRELRPHNWRHQFIFAAITFVSFLTCIGALAHLPFIIFYIAIFSAPMVVAILQTVFLKEPMGLGKSFAIVIGFVGVIVAIDPLGAHADLHGNVIGYVLAAANVVCFATLMVLQRYLSRTETTDSLAFIQALFQVGACGLWLLYSSVPLPPLLMLTLAIGGVFSILGTLCNIIATKHAPAATIAQFHYTQIISGAIIGFLVWHEMPTAYLVAGSVIIIASGLYIANRTRKGLLDPTVKSP